MSAVTLKGTRRSYCLAGLLFAILLSPVLAEMQEWEVSLGLAFGPSKVDTPLFAKDSYPQEVLCTDVTFADDSAVLGVPPGLVPADMLGLIRGRAQGIHNIFARMARIPNFDVVKSSLLLVAAGKNAHRYKKVLFDCDWQLDRRAVLSSQTCRHQQTSGFDESLAVFHGRQIANKKRNVVAALAPLRKAVFRKGSREDVSLNLVDPLATCVLLAKSWLREAARHLDENTSLQPALTPRLDTAGQLSMFLSRICNSAPRALRLLLGELQSLSGSWSHQLEADCAWAVRQWSVCLLFG